LQVNKKSKVKTKKQPFDYVLVAIFLVVIVITIYPFLNVLAISFNDPIDTMRNVNFIIPRKFTVHNYVYIFTEKFFTVDELIKTNRFKRGKKYIIKKVSKGVRKEVVFRGVLQATYDFYYLFRNEKGTCECFLKIDIETGQCCVETY
jgi:ABC-type maltose transport system permease subunit